MSSYRGREPERDKHSYDSRDRDRGRDIDREHDRDREYRSSRDRDSGRDHYRRRSRSRSPRRSPRDRSGPYSPERPARDHRGGYSPRNYYPSRDLDSRNYAAPAVPPPIPSYLGTVPAQAQAPPIPAHYYGNSYSRAHPPAPPSMPWREAPAPYGYPPASTSYNHHRNPPSMVHSPYGQMGGQVGSFGSFSNLFRQDWSALNLIPFEKNFYREHPAVKERTESQIIAYRQQHAMTVCGSNIPKPVQSFEEGCFPEYISKMLSSQGFDSPTPIQAQVRIVCLFIFITNFL